MAHQSRISIALCTYNGARYLQEQLQSLRQQTRLPDELVVCDDGSTDATLSILQQFVDTAPFPARLIRNERNLRSTKNFEKAIGLCTGDWIALCDQDDVWSPEKLSRQARFLDERSNVGGVFSDAELIGANSEGLGTRLWYGIHFTAHERAQMNAGHAVPVLLRKNVVTGATLMFRAALRPKLLPIPSIWVHDGWIAWMLALHSQLAFIDQPLVRYRVHAGQQIGVESIAMARTLGLRERRKKGRHDEPAKHRAMAAEMEALRAGLMRSGGANQEPLIRQLEAKRTFLLERTVIESGGAGAILQVVRHARDYWRFENGWKPFVRDLLMLLV
jgi:glycosyltransferase involved in cell wall biosynthesis